MLNVTKSLELNKKQTEKLADLLLDLGKLVYGSMVLGLFQTGLKPGVAIVVSLLGLTVSISLFILGIRLIGGRIK